jgi:cytochrome c553
MIQKLAGMGLLCLFLLTGCGGTIEGNATLPPGDAAQGELLFQVSIQGAPTCTSCHLLDGQRLNGPPLNGFSQIAGTRVEGESAEEYTSISITRPAAHIVSGYANVMYNQYKARLTDQQLADLVAYLLTL